MTEKQKFFQLFSRPTRRFGILGAQLGDAFEGAIFKAHEGKQFAPLENLFPSRQCRGRKRPAIRHSGGAGGGILGAINSYMFLYKTNSRSRYVCEFVDISKTTVSETNL